MLAVHRADAGFAAAPLADTPARPCGAGDASVDDAMWQETFDVYVKDKHNLGLGRVFDEKSPWRQARIVEAELKGYLMQNVIEPQLNGKIRT